MPVIVTTIHDPDALAETCRRVGLETPGEGAVPIDGRRQSGWVMHLPGLDAPLVIDTLSGLVTYGARDNGFDAYARIMRFVHRVYDVAAELRRRESGRVPARPARRRRAAGEVA